MDNAEFDAALVASAFSLAAERGWSRVSVAQAARDADLPLDRARRRFPGRCAVLLRFGSLADQAALALATNEGIAPRPAVRHPDAPDRLPAAPPRRRAGAAAPSAGRPAAGARAGRGQPVQHGLDAGRRRHFRPRAARAAARARGCWRSGCGRCAPGSATTARICRRPWRRSTRRCRAPNRRRTGWAGAACRRGRRIPPEPAGEPPFDAPPDGLPPEPSGLPPA